LVIGPNPQIPNPNHQSPIQIIINNKLYEYENDKYILL